MTEVEKVREGVALEYGIQLYKLYSEPEAAHLIGIHHDSLKEMRREGKTPYVNLGPRKKRYLGIHIVDLIAFGDKWRDIPSESSKLANTTSPSEKAAPLGTAQATMHKPSAHDALALARTTLQKPAKR